VDNLVDGRMLPRRANRASTLRCSSQPRTPTLRDTRPSAPATIPADSRAMTRSRCARPDTPQANPLDIATATQRSCNPDAPTSKVPSVECGPRVARADVIDQEHMSDQSSGLSQTQIRVDSGASSRVGGSTPWVASRALSRPTSWVPTCTTSISRFPRSVACVHRHCCVVAATLFGCGPVIAIAPTAVPNTNGVFWR
jgi:hypothetical protein